MNKELYLSNKELYLSKVVEIEWLIRQVRRGIDFYYIHTIRNNDADKSFTMNMLKDYLEFDCKRAFSLTCEMLEAVGELEETMDKIFNDLEEIENRKEQF